MSRLISRFTSTRALPDATYTGASNAAVILSQSYAAANTESILPTFQSFAGEGYAGNGIVFSVVLRRLQLFSQAEFKFRNQRDKSLFGTPALAVLENPWPNGTTAELLARMEQDVSLAGNAFIRYDGERLYRLRPDWVDIVRYPRDPSGSYIATDNYDIAGYMHWPIGRNTNVTEFFTVDEIAHWSPIPDPLATFRGMSWLTPVVREINADLAMTAYKRNFMDNNATPNSLIKYQGKLEQGSWERLMTRWQARHGGPDGWKTGILDEGADFQVIGNSFEQMTFTALQEAGETRIASAGGVPPIVMGLQSGLNAATYSNYGMAMRSFADLTMRPNWQSACAALAKFVDVPAGAQLWYDTTGIAALAEGESDMAKRLQINAQTASNLLVAGYEPNSVTAAVTSGDFSLLVHTGLVSVQLIKDRAAADAKAAVDNTDVPDTTAPEGTPS